MDEPVFFSQAMEGLYVRGLGVTPDSSLGRLLKAEGIDLGKPLQVAYPWAVWDRAVLVAAAHVHPTLPLADAVAELGRSFLLGYGHTLVGRAVFATARVIGVERTLMRMDRNNRTASNFFTSHTERVAPGHMRIENGVEARFEPFVTTTDPAQLHFPRGIVLGIFEVLGAPKPVVEVTPLDLARNRSRLDVRWPV